MTDRNQFNSRPRRVPMRILISYSTLGAFLDSEIMNLSKGGVFIRSDITLPLGSEVDFEFTLPNSDKPIKALGVVVWARKGGTPGSVDFPEHPPGMGIQFKEMDIDDLDFLLAEIKRVIEKS